MYLSLIENNRGFSRKKIWPSFPVSENEVKYSHLPEMKVEFYTLFQSQRGKKHIMLGDTDIRKATYGSTTSLVGLFCRSPKMVINKSQEIFWVEFFLRLKGIEWYLEKLEYWKILVWSRNLRSKCQFWVSFASWYLAFFANGSQSFRFVVFFLSVSRIFQNSWAQLIELS